MWLLANTPQHPRQLCPAVRLWAVVVISLRAVIDQPGMWAGDSLSGRSIRDRKHVCETPSLEVNLT